MILNLLFIEGYFIITILQFFAYFIIFSIFGSIGFLLISKKRIERGSKISFILISFAIGVCLHVFYLLIIITFQIFNVLTIYLPFIVIDICFIIYRVKKNNIKLKEKIKAVTWKKMFLLLKSNISNFLMLAVIFVLLYIFQMFIIWQRIGYPSIDPYLWFGEVWSIHNNRSLNFDLVGVYPPGFVLFTSSLISLNDNFLNAFFFCKYLPFFLTVINLIALYEILKFFFKKKIIIFCALLLFLSNQYYFYRFSMLVPSTLSTTLGFLFILTLKEGSIVNMLSNENKLRKKFFLKFKIKNILTRGIILSGITMAHPLYGLYYIIFYFLFEIFSFIITLIRNRSNMTFKLINIGQFFIQLISILSIFFVMMLPYLIYYSLTFGNALWDAYSFYFKPLYLYDPLSGIFKIGEMFIKMAEDLLYNTKMGDFELDIFKLIFTPVRNTNIVHFSWIFGSGIIFIIIGIFIPVNYFFHLNKKQKNLVRFIKFSFVFTVLIYMAEEWIKFPQNLKPFLEVYLIRLIELFSGFWVIIFLFPFVFIIVLVKRLIRKIIIYKKLANKRGFRKIIGKRIVRKFRLYKILAIRRGFKKIKEKKLINRYFNAFFSILIICLSGIYYTLNYPRTLGWSTHYFDEGQTDVVLVAGNYFDENPLDEENILLVENGPYYHFLYDIIQVENLKKRYFNFDYTSDDILDFTDYLEFKGNLEAMNISYGLFTIKFPNVDFQTNLTNDFNILYINEDGWMFIKIK